MQLFCQQITFQSVSSKRNVCMDRKSKKIEKKKWFSFHKKHYFPISLWFVIWSKFRKYGFSWSKCHIVVFRLCKNLSNLNFENPKIRSGLIVSGRVELGLIFICGTSPQFNNANVMTRILFFKL